ncbi:hypothetical protein LJC17_03415 [Acholeplasma sp. OttesenSCG-928-E16]|nr:hypothetical protein [Acholeplasma sp. OttesenSCG-928-E16]
MWFLWTVIIIGVVALIFGLGLGFANKYFEVKEDERIADIEKLLPGYNCGACGMAGCKAFAEGVISGQIDQLSRCKPGKKDKNFEPILEYLKNHPNEDGSVQEIKL